MAAAVAASKAPPAAKAPAPVTQKMAAAVATPTPEADSFDAAYKYEKNRQQAFDDAFVQQAAADEKALLEALLLPNTAGCSTGGAAASQYGRLLQC